MLARLAIRLLSSLAGIAAGIVVSAAVLSGFSTTTGAIVAGTAVFWIANLVVRFFALRVLIREPSIALAGLLALASTILALVVVNLIVNDISISGAGTYLAATLIIWLTTFVGDVIGSRMIRARRHDRR